MEKYEYKLIEMPQPNDKVWRAHKSGSAVEPVATIMNEMGENGWAYARKEMIATPVRRAFRRARFEQREYLVFRRVTARIDQPEDLARIALTEPEQIDGIKPRRVKTRGEKESARTASPIVAYNGGFVSPRNPSPA